MEMSQNLSPKEQQALNLSAQGLPVVEIARAMEVSAYFVGVLLENATEKLRDDR